MADAGTGLNAGNLGVFRHGLNETGAASGNQQIHITHGGHQLCGTGPGSILYQLYQIGRQIGGFQPCLHGGDDGVGGAEGLLAASQDAGGACFQRQGGGIGGDIGAALIDDGNDAHGNTHLLDDQPVGAHHPMAYPTHRIGQSGDLPDALRHAVDAVGIQSQSIQHDLGDMCPGGLQILCVGLQDGVCICFQSLCHGQQCPVFLLGVRHQQGRCGGFCFLQQFHGGHGCTFFPIKWVPTALPSKIS